MSTGAEQLDRRELLKNALVRIDELENRLREAEEAKAEPIAIIGMACRFPGGSNTIDEYWNLLRSGGDAIRMIPEGRLDAHELAEKGISTEWYGGFLDKIEDFDPQFFGISPREAVAMDPQQRLVLEVGWEALENAGKAPDRLGGSQTGVFLGISTTDYGHLLRRGGTENLDVYSATGAAMNAAAGRLSYTLGLNGPCMAIDTACSSSLVAIHLAVQSLRNNESDMAIAGGVNATLAPDGFVCFTNWGMLASDGRCKSFDSRADGFVRSEGCGLVVLKRYSDAVADGDNILALVRSSAINQDGRSSGLTVPNGPAQELLLRQALASARIHPSEVSYLEAHGTGTAVGDPIEVEALSNVLGEGRTQDQPLILGAVKTNLGHLESAAGIAGVIKIILAMQHKEIPRNLHFFEYSPRIPWPEHFPIIVPTEQTSWNPLNGRRIAGVSGFGFSGMNAHVILEEAPQVESTPSEPEHPLHLLALSAKSEQALHDLAARYEDFFSQHPEIPVRDAAYTANTGRALFNQRLAVVGESTETMRERLAAFVNGDASAVVQGQVEIRSRPKIAFLFTGQGSQYVGMGRRLYETEPIFRAALDECDFLLRPYLKVPLLTVIYPDEGASSPIDDTTYTQPALFALEYALAKLWMSWGIQPSAVMGHSVGEYVAACIAGVFSLEDGLKLIAERGRLMGELPSGGQMAAVFADEETVAEAVNPYAAYVSLGAVNGPESIVISGAGDAVQEILAALSEKGIKSRSLNVSHAFHSPLMEPMLDAFHKTASQVKYAQPRIKLISNVTGVMGTDVTTPAYWRTHVREAVQFNRAMQTLDAEGYTIFLEIGPGPTLIGMGQRCLPGSSAQWLPSLRSGRDDWEQMLTSLGGLFVKGVNVNWASFDQQSVHRPVPLPTYPFQRERYWADTQSSTPQARRRSSGGDHPLLGEQIRMASKDVLFENELGTAWLPYLDDHKIYGTTIFPGTAYMEMALAAGRSYFNAPVCAVQDMTIQEPLVLPNDGSRTVQLILNPDGAGQAAFRIFSLSDADGDVWKLHASGHLVPVSATTETVDLKALQASFPVEEDIPAYYAHFEEIGLNYGPLFQNVARLWRGNGEAFGQINAPGELVNQVDQYMVHPALLDACFHLIGASLPANTDAAEASVYLPVGLNRLHASKPAGAQIWCHVVVDFDESQPSGARQSYTASLRLFNQQGERVAEISGLLLMRASQDVLRKAVGGQIEDLLYEVVWEQKPVEAQIETSGDWLIFADQAGIGEGLAQLLQQQRVTSRLVYPAEVYSATEAGQVQLNPGDPEHFHRLLQEMSDSNISSVVYLWALDAVPDDLEGGSYLGCGGALHLIQAFAVGTHSQKPRLWLVTSGAQAVDSNQPVNLAQSSLWGLGRVALTEHTDLLAGLVDLDSSDAAVLYQVLTAGDEEAQIAVRQGERYVPRLVQYARPDELPIPNAESYELATTAPGTLENLTLRPVVRRAPNADEVEVEVRAAGLNFRDVLNALGMYPGEPPPLGNESVGKVVRVGENVRHVAPGDEVIVLWAGAFRQHITAPADFVFHKPAPLTPEEVITVPTTFLTAHYGLHTLANIKPGDRVLIHAAAGGVGVAAVQLALQAGAEVFGTAGSPEKRAFLKTLGVHHTLNSRTLDFADEIMQITGGKGVNIVLNSLADEFIPRSLEILADEGYFLEIGKRGIWTTEQVAELNPTLHYHVYDLAVVTLGNVPLLHESMAYLTDQIEAGHLHALPISVFPIQEAVHAFRYMAQAKHIGKVVLSFPTGAASGDSMQLHSDATYLITGGLGGLGLEVARWMVERGARHLALLGRRAPSEAAAGLLHEMEDAGAQIAVLQVDVSQFDLLSSAIDQIADSMPPIQGIVHAAGILDDDELVRQSFERFEVVLAPKISGAWNLHRLSQDLPLDFFVLFSSPSAVFGSSRQGSYAAGNAFLDMLAHDRRAAGLPALSINWGAWSEVGMAAGMEKWLAATGMGSLTTSTGLQALEFLLNHTLSSSQAGAQVTVLPVNWPKFKDQLEARQLTWVMKLVSAFVSRSEQAVKPAASSVDALHQFKAANEQDRPNVSLGYVQGQIARVMGIPSSKPIDPHQSLSSLGLDSLMAMELKNRVDADLQLNVPVTALLEGPTILQFADMVLDMLNYNDVFGDSSPSQTEAPQSNGSGTADMLTNLDNLTDADVDALLHQMLLEKEDVDE